VLLSDELPSDWLLCELLLSVTWLLGDSLSVQAALRISSDSAQDLFSHYLINVSVALAGMTILLLGIQ